MQKAIHAVFNPVCHPESSLTHLYEQGESGWGFALQHTLLCSPVARLFVTCTQFDTRATVVDMIKVMVQQCAERVDDLSAMLVGHYVPHWQNMTCKPLPTKKDSRLPGLHVTTKQKINSLDAKPLSHECRTDELLIWLQCSRYNFTHVGVLT